MIWVFLPAYNEEKALEPLVRKFDQELNRSHLPYRIVLLDDGSSDQTAAVAQKLKNEFAIELIRHDVNQGLGATMRDGLEYTAGKASPEDLIVTMDCDDTHDPKYVQAAIDKISEGYDMVILSRYQAGGGEKGLSALKSFLSRGAGTFLRLFFPIRNVKEYSCGYRVIRAGALQKTLSLFGHDFVRLAKWGFVVTAEILIKFRMAGLRIAEVPFVLRYDQKAGPSKNRPLKTIAGYFLLVFHFFGRKPSKG